MNYVGLISGTSMDALDAVVVDLEHARPRLLAARSEAIPDPLHERMRQLATGAALPISHCGQADHAFAQLCVEAIHALLDIAGLRNDQIDAIGLHGQTVWHQPTGPNRHTLQIGDPFIVASATGIPVVHDLRRADMAAGGEGAPLAPLVHQAWLSKSGETRAVINLGGIANITRLDGSTLTAGFDAGPANTLLDAWYRAHHDDCEYDDDGAWAASGVVDQVLLADLLDDEYFKRSAPKSTGPEYFNLDWLHRHAAVQDAAAADVQATLLQLTAQSIADALDASVERLLVCGGGVHNPLLMARLAEVTGRPVASTADAGVDPDWLEAMLVAWLAQQRMRRQRVDLRKVTGATRPTLLGALVRP